MVIALFFWAFIQSFLFGLTVLVYRNNRPNRILASFFFMVSTVILFQYLLKHEFWLFDFPKTLFIPDIINISIAPILFLYSRQIITRKWKIINFLHFIPALLLTLYFIFFEILPEAKFVYYNYINTTSHIAVLTLILISNITYLILFYSNYKKCSELQKKESEQVKPWLRILFVFFILQLVINFIIWTLHFNLLRINNEFVENARSIKDVIFILLNAITVFTTGLFIVANPAVITSLGTKITERLKSKSFSIADNEAKKHIGRLEKLMKEEKVFLDAQLNEKLLADKLGIQSYYLSRLMNEHIKCSFKEYINRARIDETKRLLESEKTDELTLFAIAVDSGFSSESVFYTNFKKFVGMTPNEYKKKVKGIN